MNIATVNARPLQQPHKPKLPDPLATVNPASGSTDIHFTYA
jgi:hypothetical protein